MTETLRTVAFVGLVLIVGVLSDAIATLIVTQGSSGLWRPTRLFYAATWRGARVLAARLPDRSGEYVLNAYPALSLLGLLVLWLAGLMMGRALVHRGLDQRVGGTRDWGTLVYLRGHLAGDPGVRVGARRGRPHAHVARDPFVAGHGHLALRDRLSRHGGRVVRVVARPLLPEPGHGGAPLRGDGEGCPLP